MDERTITVARDLTYPVPIIKMVWSSEFREEDLAFGFQQVVELARSGDEPAYVMVDLRAVSRLPAPVAMRGAVGEAPRNPHIKLWLVVGTAEGARHVEHIAWGITGEHKVRWFESDGDARRYLAEQTA